MEIKHYRKWELPSQRSNFHTLFTNEVKTVTTRKFMNEKNKNVLTRKRKSIGTHFSMCVQPSFIIGTNNEDGSHNFAPITWVSAACEKDDYLIVISIFGRKRTKQNINRTGIFSANLVSVDMLELMDYFGTHHAADGKKDDVPYTVSKGEVLDVPVLGASRWVYECKVEKFADIGESTTYFCRIKNIQADENLFFNDIYDVDLTKLEPVIYSGMYHSIGELLGKIGEPGRRAGGTRSRVVSE